jgi:hypothetical protein
MNRLSRLETDCVFRLLGQMMIMLMTFLQFALLSIFFYTEIYYFDVNPLWVIAMLVETRSIPRESTISALTFFWSMPLTSYCDLYVREKKSQQTCCCLTLQFIYWRIFLRPASFYSDRPFSFFSKNCEIVVIHRWLSFLSSSFIMFDKCSEEEEDKAIEIVKKLRMAAPDAPPLDIWEKVETDHRLAALRPGSHFFPAPLYLSIPRAHCERALVSTNADPFTPKGNTRIQLVLFTHVHRNGHLIAPIES